VQNLTEQICGSVRWSETIEFLLAKGDVRFREIGPAQVLTRLIAAARREGEPVRPPAPRRAASPSIALILECL
jgi:malonyl CoA-acyl carrier protein transacylase